MTITRKAERSDIPWILQELEGFSKFFGTKRPLMHDNQEYKENFLNNLVDNHACFIAEDNGVPQGFIAGFITPHFLNPDIRLLSELFWWVPEKFRLSRAGLKLLDRFLAYGKQNADWITFALETNSPVQDKSLIKRGFRLQERGFLMEL